MVPLYQNPRMSSAGNDIGSDVDPRKSSRKLMYQFAPTNVVVAMVRANNRTCSPTRSRNFGRGCQTAAGVGSKLADILQVFARFEADRASRRNADFLAGPWVAADAALARLDLEDAEAAQLDALAPLHGGPHRVEHPIAAHLSFPLGKVGNFRHLMTMSTLIMLRVSRGV